MYGNWENWNKKRYNVYGDSTRPGIAGCNVIMKRTALDKIGLWDERILGADFDIFLRTKTRYIEQNDIKPVQLLVGVYFHHFSRMTSKSKFPPYKDRENLIRLEDKWEKKSAVEMLKEADMTL